MIVCAGNQEKFNFAKSIGVGLINSTITLTQICLFNRPDYILFVGSAGSYGNYNIFDILESRSSANIELSFLNNDSYTPLDNVISSDNKFTKNDTIVNSSNYITTNFNLSKEFKKYNIGIENMEFFGLLSVAKKFGVPIGGIFVITNYTNSNAHRDFNKNHVQGMKTLIKYLKHNNIIKE